METTAQVHYTSAADMAAVDDGSVHLVVTSPPYPMIEMWDAMFTAQDAAIGEALDAADGTTAFRLMHEQMRPVWDECFRVLTDGGILCLNIGDATRNIGGQFKLYPNHAHVVSLLTEIGFDQLPGILWRKPTNSPSKFLGSGALGLNAYVTLEHEHVLIFRKGGNRTVSGDAREARYESAYFWEERNRWFSDVWMDLRGTRQATGNGHADLRERSAAFPLELPLRLIEMYSIYGDTVLDPFVGTGTTSIAAAMTARHSIGYEIEPAFHPLLAEQMARVPHLSRERNRSRLKQHRDFVRQRKRDGKAFKHRNTFYDMDVVMAQEKGIVFYDATEVTSDGAPFRIHHAPHVEQKELFTGL